jgi:hypothetical protein
MFKFSMLSEGRVFSRPMFKFSMLGWGRDVDLSREAPRLSGSVNKNPDFGVNDRPQSGWLGFAAKGREDKSTSVP